MRSPILINFLCSDIEGLKEEIRKHEGALRPLNTNPQWLLVINDKLN